MSQLLDHWMNAKRKALTFMTTPVLEAEIQQQISIIEQYDPATKQTDKPLAIKKAEFIAAQGQNLLAERKNNSLTYSS